MVQKVIKEKKSDSEGSYWNEVDKWRIKIGENATNNFTAIVLNRERERDRKKNRNSFISIKVSTDLFWRKFFLFLTNVNFYFLLTNR